MYRVPEILRRKDRFTYVGYSRQFLKEKKNDDDTKDRTTTTTKRTTQTT